MTTSYNLIDIPDDLWERFKKTIDKSQTMGEGIISLIKKHVEEEEKKK